MKVLQYLEIIIPLLLFVSCSTNVASGTSETTNGMVVAGVAVYEDGTPASYAEVYLNQSDYLSDSTSLNESQIPTAVTDSNGYFEIDSVMQQRYSLEINNGEQFAVMRSFDKLSDSEPVNLDSVMLQQVSAFYGSVDRTNIASTDQLFVQLYGTHRIARVNDSGDFYFNGLPAAQHRIRVFSNNSDYGVIEEDTVEVHPAENRDAGVYIMPFEYWHDSFSVQVILDSNGLTDVSVDEVTTVVNGRIIELDLTGYGITQLPPIVGSLRLKHLHLGNNQLDSIPGSVGTITTLKSLLLQKNQLSTLPAGMAGLTHLERLELSGNSLISLPDEITNIKSLTELSVQNNHLVTVSPAVTNWLDMYSSESNWRDSQSP